MDRQPIRFLNDDAYLRRAHRRQPINVRAIMANELLGYRRNLQLVGQDIRALGHRFDITDLAERRQLERERLQMVRDRERLAITDTLNRANLRNRISLPRDTIRDIIKFV